MRERVPPGHNHAPLPAAEGDPLPVLDLIDPARKRRRKLNKLAAAGHQFSRGRFVEAMPDEKIAMGLAGAGHVLAVADPGPGPFGERAHEIRIEAFKHPARESDMVDVPMGSDEAPERPPLHRFSKQGFPSGEHSRVGAAGIDDCPALPLGQDPDVDVVQPERQRQACPEQSGSDFHSLALRGSIRPRKRELVDHEAICPASSAFVFEVKVYLTWCASARNPSDASVIIISGQGAPTTLVFDDVAGYAYSN